jgi:prepilin-type N-terminal cleavage/methylation domain-containing protein
MTFPHKTKLRSPRHQSLLRSEAFSPAGFTLLEIVIVLMVFALILGGAITTIVLSSSERALRNASGEIELLAKKARTAAILHQKPYAIEFHENSMRLLPFAEASDTERTTALGNDIGGTAPDGESGTTLREDITIDPDITLTLRRWNTSDFLAPSKNSVPIWRFDPNGLSEPVTVRLTIGESYAQDTYHPLTATIADSELDAK